MLDKYKSHYKSNIKLAYPVVLSQLGHTLMSIIDSVLVGQTGAIPLAAVSLGTGIFTFFLVIGIGISYGLTPLVAQSSGQNNKSVYQKLLSSSLAVNIITGLILALMVFVTSFHLDILKQKPEVIAQTETFLILLGVSVIPLMIFQTFKQFAEGLGHTREAMKISIWGNFINAILCIVFIFGYLGAPKMGINGAGLATLISRVLMAIAMYYVVLKTSVFQEYLPNFSILEVSSKYINKILKIGGPVSLQYIFEIGAFSGAAIMIGWFSAIDLAAHQIGMSMSMMSYMMASGIAAAAGVKSGNYFGKKDFFTLRLSSLSCYHIVCLLMILAAICFAILNNIIPILYTKDSEVILVASKLLLIAALYQIFDGTQVVGLGILRGMGDVKIPTFITFVAYWIIGLPLGYILGVYLEFGIYGIWWSLLLGLLFSSVALYWRFSKLIKGLIKTV